MNSNDFRYYLQRYINNGCLDATDKLVYLVAPGIVFKRNAAVIQKYFHDVEKEERGSKTVVPVKVDVYNGKNKFAFGMKSYLEKNLRNDLAGAYVHGSIGTSDEIDYSDFDGLVILKDDVFEDKKKLAHVAHLLCSARWWMLQMDPLQHHGWFVMTESNLKNYPDAWFPSTLFHHAKSLFKDRGLELSLAIDPLRQDYSSPFKNLCGSIEEKLGSHQYPRHVYGLKNLLSEFMLLPALYVQARDKRGVYKKYSFEKARIDFSADEWLIMDEVSLMRQRWKCSMSATRERLVASPRFFSLQLAKLLAPRIPDELDKKLNMQFYQSMLGFTKMISRKIQ